MCEVIFVHIHWTKPGPSLTNTLFSHLVLCNCSMKQAKFSVIGLASVVEMIGTEMLNCSGWKSGVPLLLVSSLHEHSGVLRLLSCNFLDNKGTVLSTRDLAEASVLHSTFEGNWPPSSQTVIVVGAKLFVLQGSVFVRNFGSPLRLLDATPMNMTACTFSNNIVSADSVLLLGGMSNIGIEDSSFLENWGTASGLVISVLHGESTVFIKVHFGCFPLQ